MRALLLVLVVGCGGGSAVETPDADDTGDAGDTDVPPDTDTDLGGPDTDVPAAACKLEGTWTLVRVRCGTADITADYETVYVTTELRISKAEAGGCHIDATVASDLCEQHEVWYTDDGPGPGGVVEREGVTSCTPTGCRFSAAHQQTCALGANVALDPVAIDDGLKGHLIFHGLLEELVPQCGGGLAMAFAGP